MRILSFGYDADLLLPEDEANESQYRQRRYCELLDQEKVIVILGADLPCRERLLAGGRIRVVGVPARSKLQQVYLACRQGVALGRQFRPDCVEYQDPRLAGLVAWWTARRLRLPLIGGLFNDLLDNPIWLRQAPAHRLYNRIGKYVLSRSLLVRCDSPETTRALNDKGYAQVRYIPFFIPWLERFAVSEEVQQERLRRWQDEPVVLNVARLARGKNVALLLRAFARTVSTWRRGRLVIVGSGDLEDELKRLAVELDIDRQVTWTGAVGYTDLPRYYQEANLFALSSDSETSARVLVLAQAARLPTVTTATSGSGDIVSDGQTGYVTPVGDVEAFADALDRLLNDRAVYQRMLKSNAYRALEQHGEQIIVTELRAFYGSLTSGR